MPSEPRGFRLEIPWPAKPKARPRFDSRSGRAYHSKEYQEWLEGVAEFVMLQKVPSLQGTVGLDLLFRRKSVLVLASEVPMDRFGQADIDNLCGGVMDAITMGRGWKDDRQVVALRGQFDINKAKEKRDGKGND